MAEPDVAPLVPWERVKKTDDGAWSHLIGILTYSRMDCRFYSSGFTEAIDNNFIDEIALAQMMVLNGLKAANEGILTGISGGYTFAVAMEVANKAQKDLLYVCWLTLQKDTYLVFYLKIYHLTWTEN